MTTKVLIVNYGPQPIVVDTMSKSVTSHELGSTSHDLTPLDLVSREDIISVHSERDFLVYDTQYLVVKERPWVKQ